MKQFVKNLIIFLLKRKAKRILSSSAKIIGVTGSMGKTTAKNAIVHVLEKKYSVLSSPEGFNTEIGILLSLVGETESGFSSPWKWLKILSRVLTKTIEIPDVVVLEYGVDKPGDMAELLTIVHPRFAVVTRIGPMHLSEHQFKNISQIRLEKQMLPEGLPKNGTAILNFDDAEVKKMKDFSSAPVIGYGEEKESTYHVRNAFQKESGIVFDVQKGNAMVSYAVPILGVYHTSVLLPAIILGEEFGIPMELSAAYLKTFSPPPGRGRIIRGSSESIIWDSSYNSGLVATKAALRTLPEIPARRKLALLGNMNELGGFSAQFHEELGSSAAENADEIFFVGKEQASFSKGVKGKKPLMIFPDAESAGNHLKTHLKKGDFLLVKGSQNEVFLERAVRMLLLDPADAGLLCRQGEEWGKK